MAWVRWCFAAWTALGLVWVVGALFAKRDVYIEPWWSRVGHLTPLLVAAVLVFTPPLGERFAWAEATFLPEPLGPVGLAITVVGVAFTIWARVVLGNLWSGRVTLKEGHRLVKTGPFAFTRHPIYTGALTAGVGTALADGRIRVALGLALAAFAFVRKIGVEEGVLAKEFGQEHAEYRARVARLVPFLW
jgi:protein-S-isoprenylcysteine O-methyltransferase Ste14